MLLGPSGAAWNKASWETGPGRKEKRREEEMEWRGKREKGLKEKREKGVRWKRDAVGYKRRNW